MSDKFVRIAALAQVFSVALLLGVPTAILAQILYAGPQGVTQKLTGIGIEVAPDLPFHGLAVAYVIIALSLLCTIGALWHMSRLFGCFRRQQVIHLRSTYHVTRLGQFLLIRALLSIISVPVLTVLLTIQQPAGERQLAFALSTQDIWALLGGALLVMIGYAFSRAVEIEVENRAFI